KDCQSGKLQDLALAGSIFINLKVERRKIISQDGFFDQSCWPKKVFCQPELSPKIRLIHDLNPERIEGSGDPEMDGFLIVPSRMANAQQFFMHELSLPEFSPPWLGR
ncbi:MAG: hypothetical protein LWW75_06185, partial [Chlorobiales bacterium]|nr:hypothetical protein [Chlorobiales bacterium]